MEKKEPKKKGPKKKVPSFSRKRSHKGTRGERDKPVYYDELKRNCNLTFTPTALVKLEELALKNGMSRSEVIEQWLRSQIQAGE